MVHTSEAGRLEKVVEVAIAVSATLVLFTLGCEIVVLPQILLVDLIGTRVGLGGKGKLGGVAACIFLDQLGLSVLSTGAARWLAKLVCRIIPDDRLNK